MNKDIRQVKLSAINNCPLIVMTEERATELKTVAKLLGISHLLPEPIVMDRFDGNDYPDTFFDEAKYL